MESTNAGDADRPHTSQLWVEAGGIQVATSGEQVPESHGPDL